MGVFGLVKIVFKEKGQEIWKEVRKKKKENRKK